MRRSMIDIAKTVSSYDFKGIEKLEILGNLWTFEVEEHIEKMQPVAKEAYARLCLTTLYESLPNQLNGTFYKEKIEIP